VAQRFPAWVGQSARYGGVGVIALAIDAAVLEAALRLGASPYAGRIVSLSAMVCSTWWLNRRFTFRTATPPSWREFGHYVVLALAGLLLNYGLFVAVTWATGRYWAGLAAGSAAAAVFNFFRYRKLFAD